MRTLRFTALLAAGVILATASAARTQCAVAIAESLGDTKVALAAGEQARILVIGDSLTMNEGAWLPVFRAHMQATYGNAGHGYQGCSLWTGGGFNAGWVQGMVNQDTAPHHSLDGLWVSSSSHPFPPVATNAHVDVRASTAVLHYAAGPGGGSFRVSLSNEEPVTISTEGASNEVRTYTRSVLAAERRLHLQPVGDGWITILGVDNQETAPGVRIHRAANGGWGVDEFLRRDWTFDKQVALLDPHLVMIWLGQNDQGVSRPQYAALIGQLVSRVRASAPGAEFLLIGTYNEGSVNLPNTVLGMRDAAIAGGHGFVDLHTGAGSEAYFESSGYLIDGIHFSPAGGEYMGRLVFDVFETEGASLAGGVFVQHPQGRGARSGQTVAMSGLARGKDELTYRWERDGDVVGDGARLGGAATPRLTISPVLVTDAGEYTLVVTSACGSAASAAAALSVQCATDYSGDGDVGSNDITAFLGAWFNDLANGTTEADFNADGAATSADLTEFLTTWFATIPWGC
ncbi:MAG: hypothetical protein H7Y88_00065 [Phycisphaerales bacterium]|nr:hypothetical protein [Phycisphaerales bacterium]